MKCLILLPAADGLQPKTIKHLPSWNRLGLTFDAKREYTRQEEHEAPQYEDVRRKVLYDLDFSWMTGRRGRWVTGGQEVLRKQGSGLEWVLSESGGNALVGHSNNAHQ